MQAHEKRQHSRRSGGALRRRDRLAGVALGDLAETDPSKTVSPDQRPA